MGYYKDLDSEFPGGLYGRAESLRRVGLPLFLVVTVLGAGLLTSANAQIALEKKPVRVTVQGELSSYWGVSEAGFREESTGTGGYLKIKNISQVSLRDAIFYGEYFDVKGRLCFSLVFSQGENDLVGVGESRDIDSIGSGLLLAAEPEEMKLYLVQVGLPNQPNPLRKWSVSIRAPVTVEGEANSKLQLGPEVTSRQEPFLDLMLARVTVDESGQVKSVTVLEHTKSQIEPWFRDFVKRQAEFFPATVHDAPQLGDALILIRVILRGKEVPGIFASPRTTLWVKSYVDAIIGGEVPPLTTFVFTRPATKVKPMSSSDFVDTPPWPPGLFELAVGASYWSGPAVQWVFDPAMPHNRRREVGLSKQ
jgi:hypothetical protein